MWHLTDVCFESAIASLITITTKMTACWLHAVWFEVSIASLRSLQRWWHGDCTMFWGSHRLITITTKMTACWLHAVCFEAPITSLQSLQRRRHADFTLSLLKLPSSHYDYYKDDSMLLHAVCFEVPIASLWSLQRLHAVCFEAPNDSLRSLQRRRRVNFTLSVLKLPSTHYDHYKDDGVLTSRCLFWSWPGLLVFAEREGEAPGCLSLAKDRCLASSESGFWRTLTYLLRPPSRLALPLPQTPAPLLKVRCLAGLESLPKGLFTRSGHARRLGLVVIMHSAGKQAASK